MTPSGTTRTKLQPCLDCGYLTDSATFGGDALITPSPGDFTICIKCGNLMVFTDDMGFREPNDAEVKEIAGNPRLLAMQRARAATKDRP